ncbi:hypothetical protein Esti_003299 [Eimeria stiedai]
MAAKGHAWGPQWLLTLASNQHLTVKPPPGRLPLCKSLKMGEMVAEKEAPGEALLSQGQLSTSLCAFCQFLRGSLAGTMAKTAVYPFDRLKMRLQVKSTVAHATFSLRQLPHDLRQLVRSEGFLSLWKGNSSALCRAFPHSGVVYFSFEHYLKFLENYNGGHAKINRLIAGAAAGMTSTCITYPLDVLNTRMSVTKHRLSYRQASLEPSVTSCRLLLVECEFDSTRFRSTIFALVVALLKHDGLVSVYRGFVPTLLGIMPYASISFFTFETLKQHFRDRNQTFTTTNAVVCGGFAGAIGQTVTYPLDTVRKLMQANTLLYKFQDKGNQMNYQHPASWRTVTQARSILQSLNPSDTFTVAGFSAAGISFTLNESFRGTLEGSMCATCGTAAVVQPLPPEASAFVNGCCLARTPGGGIRLKRRKHLHERGGNPPPPTHLLPAALRANGSVKK